MMYFYSVVLYESGLAQRNISGVLVYEGGITTTEDFDTVIENFKQEFSCDDLQIVSLNRL